MLKRAGMSLRGVGDQEERPPINWRRGFLRIWVLLSAAWIMAWAIYLITAALHGGFRTTADILVLPVVLLGPPVALLLCGLAAAWAFRGFKVDDEKFDAE
jgi:hypothetical protein